MGLTPDQWTTTKVRDTFFNFFREKNHALVSSASVLPLNDLSLPFADTGMNQYASAFLGTADGNSEPAYPKCAMSSQKCIRAGGKHNDLENVGKDSYHHTFFEMLGTWSIGDCFKRETFQAMWELLTKKYGLDTDRLYVSYFAGDASRGLHPDREAMQLLRAAGVTDGHIIPGSIKDNFWKTGDQGPCGPCVHLHYDRIGRRNAAPLVHRNDPTVIKIWNVAFIQFQEETDGSLRPLSHRIISTGMGLERLVSVLQNKSSNYDTDVFFPLFKRIEELTGARAYEGKFGDQDSDGVDTAYRVVADHIRTCTIAITDGTMPKNDWNGYVIRRILRRGVRYAKRFLNANIGAFFSQIVPTVVEHLGTIFPEVRKGGDDVKRILNEEETAFASKFIRGETIFNQYVFKCRSQKWKYFPGEYVWLLYAKYGFPFDLTRLMAKEQSLCINEKDVKIAQNEALKAIKNQKNDRKKPIMLDVDDIANLENMGAVPKTDDASKYNRGVVECTIKAIFFDKKFLQSTSTIPEGDPFGLLLDKTNFFTEVGGQVSDTGRVVDEGVAEAEIWDVQSYRGYILHTACINYGSFSVEDKMIAIYDESRRYSTQKNHTGTHILNFAMREVLGATFDQRGTLITPEKLRIDFLLKSPLTVKELKTIEEIAIHCINSNFRVFSSKVDLSTARSIKGVRFSLRETYQKTVRLVFIGMDVEALVSGAAFNGDKYSIEFCVGTHVDRTGEIKELVIVDEFKVGEGIRSIIAVTGQEAEKTRRIATRFEQKLIRLEQMSTASLPAKEKLAAETRAELDGLSISILTKQDFIERHDKATEDPGHSESHLVHSNRGRYSPRRGILSPKGDQ